MPPNLEGLAYAKKEGIFTVCTLDRTPMCLNATTGAIIKQLATGEGECDAAMASITITSEREAMGVQFAFPYTKGSIGIMVKTEKSTSNGWAWVQPFSTDLWIAIALTMMLWPVAILLVELYSMRRRVARRQILHGAQEALWKSLWALQHGETINVNSLGARLAVITFSFLALIICSSYTANLAAFLTARRISSINSTYDLSGLAVSSVPAYIPRLRTRYGLIASDANISSVIDVQEAAELVAQGKLAAFLYDEPVLRYVTATFPGCAVRLLPEAVEPFDFGMAFKKSEDPALVRLVSASILKLQEEGEIQDLAKKYYLLSSPCLSTVSETDTSRITFDSVYGLWIILAGGLLAGILLMMVFRWKKMAKWRAKEKKDEENMAATVAGSADPKQHLDRARSDLEDPKSDFI